ncbi:MAG: hypothetical protein EMLJLAPB_00245 [Candidatus Argoarchaeum ethanivorans]|uniref:Uncharacterized protein n=1 Tax=Candidatus Argoarchaeum ethanivorans TaxID=2608793 RepID=A0A811TCI7_9EURY|nr:MAG: hypothetical protein EMLJLAPB_00245 [Candidatus Argoarchaeum ethanivorans]
MKKMMVLILCFVMLTGIASAGYEHEELKKYVDYYNKHAEKVPKFFKPIFGDHEINVHILNDNDTVFGVRTDGTFVSEFNKEPFEKPDMDVYVNQSLIDRVLAEDRSVTRSAIKHELAKEDSGLAASRAAYNEALDTGDLRCVSHRMGLKVRMFVLNLLM